MFRYVGTLLSTIAAVAIAAGCNREMLQAGTDSLIEAQHAGNPGALHQISATFVYSENQKTRNITSGILSQPLTIDHTRSSLDTTQCATYTELIAAHAAKPYVIGAQMYWTGDSISKIDILTTSTGDWAFNATGTLYWASKEDWSTIPEAQRDSRATIQAAADAYCDIFSNKSVVVPWGHPCARLEGGISTGTGSPNDRCDVGIPDGVSLTNRKYVIDETVGAVDVMMSFAGIPDSHEFRVEAGKIRFVHTMTVMTARNGSSSGMRKRLHGRL
ncbi:hypothetical protein CONLIGDRAFT_707947 [Coniochaeta ligniaria NRRL 30616]|uniref:DUF8021 domain-containing protein n=1 Tax=Coniochaeta ligniaria NRRL 30616 TaxID=1408157 RepID=A0A1J7III7_9PEZI|nr:hypothetical protein CONLIGDRAFT_707947 [Coniochaeta ligniaria NRRL 30616]